MSEGESRNRAAPEAMIALETGGEHPRPVVAGTAVTVATVVQALHETTIDRGLESLAIPGLDRETVDPVLTYCAELKCEAAGAICPGCRRETASAGIATLDQFVASYRRIEIGSGGPSGLAIEGDGDRTGAFASLDHLVRTWAGEDFWFWARRVIRKLRHGVRRADMVGAPFAGDGETPAIVLMEPQLADNIGMVARAMGNFGLDALRLVAPRDGWPNEKARFAASGANFVVDDAVAYPTLDQAIGDLNWLCATTARQRDLKKPVLTPVEAVAELRTRIAAGERCGILFGRERNGLETNEVANADAIVMIPVNSRFASINLAQAVLILGYEWMRADDRASLGRVTTYETPLTTGINLRDDRPATKAELLGLFEHMESELERLGFFNPSHRRSTVSRNLRTMLSRAAPTEQEVRTFRGIVATLAQGKGVGRKAP
ncbi:MAG: RNA methyltransferase [Hyphomicrobiaceae bacterium]